VARALDTAREQIAEGKYKKAVETLWVAEAESRADAEQTRALTDGRKVDSTACRRSGDDVRRAGPTVDGSPAGVAEVVHGLPGLLDLSRRRHAASFAPTRRMRISASRSGD
jgi:hypothetical protein